MNGRTVLVASVLLAAALSGCEAHTPSTAAAPQAIAAPVVLAAAATAPVAAAPAHTASDRTASTPAVSTTTDSTVTVSTTAAATPTVSAAATTPRTLRDYQQSLGKACQRDADCMVKNVGSCCGYSPQCVHKDAQTFPEQVKALCEKEGRSSICGFQEPAGCSCVNNQCRNSTAAGI